MSLCLHSQDQKHRQPGSFAFICQKCLDPFFLKGAIIHIRMPFSLKVNFDLHILEKASYSYVLLALFFSLGLIVLF